MNYIIMIILLGMLLIMLLPVLRYEIFNPTITVLLMFLGCMIFGLVRWDDWEIDKYSINAVILIMIGIMAFSTIGVFVSQFKNTLKVNPIRHQRLDVSNLFIVIALIWCFGGCLLFLDYINYVVVGLNKNNNSVSEMIQSYYIIKGQDANRGIYAIPPFLSLTKKIIPVVSAFSEYILIHNVCFHKFQAKDVVYGLIILACIIFSLIDSNRGSLLQMLAIGMYLMYFFLNMYYGWNKKVNLLILKKGIKIFILFIVLFVALAVGIGRYKSLSDMDIVNYVTIYISSGVRNFDLFLEDPVSSEIWGKETFAGFNRFLAHRFGIGEIYGAPLEFRSILGKNIGNIYTAFRRYYADFGISGLIIFPMLLSAFFTAMYIYNRSKAYKDKLGVSVLVFAYLSRAIFYMPIDDTFFEFDITLGRLFEILLLMFLYYVFIKRNLRFKIRK